MKQAPSNSGYVTIPLKKGDIQRLNITAEQIIVIGGTLWAKVKADDPRIDTAECNRLFWKTQKQEQRHARCIVYNEKTGRIIKCRKKCSECEREFRSPYVSLDNIQEKKPELFTYEEEGYGLVDAECTYDKIMSKLRDINPTYADSLHRFYTTGDCNISKLAREEGVAISTMHERIHRAINLVRLIYDGEI